MIHGTKRLLGLAAVVIVGMLAVQRPAAAQGNIDTCIIINGCWCYVILDPCGNIVYVNCPCGGTGVAQFGPEDVVIPAEGPLDVSLTPQYISASVVDPVYGTITTTLDASRTAPNTTIRSNDRNKRFPATGDIQFYANTTLSSAPGIIYASVDPVELVNSNLGSVNPFVREKFVTKRKVAFYNTADLSQSTAFVLQANSDVTLDGNNGDDNGIH